MNPDTLQLDTVVPDTELAPLKGRAAETSHFSRVVDRDTDVLRPDGTLLLSFRKSAVLTAAWSLALPSVERYATRPDPLFGRKMATGGDPRFRSGTVGFMSGELRHVTSNPARRDWWNLHPLTCVLADVFREARPDEFARHTDLVGGIAEDLFVPGAPFTSLVCNRHDTRADFNARTRFHPDGNNVAGAYGAMSVAGCFTGGLLVFPKFRVAVNLRPGDVLIADNTELHGNTAIHGQRLSVVAFAHDSNAPAE